MIGQHHRALHLLARFEQNEATSDVRGRLLALQCYVGVQDWDAALRLMDCETPQGIKDELDMRLAELLDGHAGNEAPAQAGTDLSIKYALVCLHMGRVNLAVENRERASLWLNQALVIDPMCTEAFDVLTESHLLSAEAERSLLLDLSLGGENQWLHLLYSARIKDNVYSSDVSRKLPAPGSGLETPGKESSSTVLARLRSNSDFLAASAMHHFCNNRFRKCHELTERILERDPYHEATLPIHVSTLVELGDEADLFYYAHKLADEFPHSAISFYAVGSYYYLVRQFDKARRYFGKATAIDHRFAPGWVGFGHAFAALDETDQAMSAYRTASRLFAGTHLPLLYIGMEYFRTNNLALAELWYANAKNICPRDPLVYNEIGVVAYQNGQYATAIERFCQALDMVENVKSSAAWEPTFFNLGHAYRKNRNFAKAQAMYEIALSLVPKNASALAAIGFTLHLQGKLEPAIEYYHRSLGMDPSDGVVSELLSKAMERAFESNNYAASAVRSEEMSHSGADASLSLANVSAGSFADASSQDMIMDESDTAMSESM